MAKYKKSNLKFQIAGMLALTAILTVGVFAANKPKEITESSAATCSDYNNDSVACFNQHGCTYTNYSCSRFDSNLSKCPAGRCTVGKIEYNCSDAFKTLSSCKTKPNSCTPTYYPPTCTNNISGYADFCRVISDKAGCVNAGKVLGVNVCKWVTNKFMSCEGKYYSGNKCLGSYYLCTPTTTVCKYGQVRCNGTNLLTCLPNGSSWIQQPCPQGTACATDSYTNNAYCK